MTQEKSELEEKFWKSQIALSILPDEDGSQYDKELKTTFLKLFAVSINEECQSIIKIFIIN